MTPIPERTSVQVDSTVKELHYGELLCKYYDSFGKVMRRQYVHQLRTMSYEVEFPDGEKHWFLEKELI